MSHKVHNIGVAAQIGAYSDAVETAPNLRWLFIFISATPGPETNGNLPTDIGGQSELAWKHILRILAGMTVADIVKVTTYLTRPEDIPAYAKIRNVVPQLVRPQFLLEVEIIAAQADAKNG